MSLGVLAQVDLMDKKRKYQVGNKMAGGKRKTIEQAWRQGKCKEQDSFDSRPPALSSPHCRLCSFQCRELPWFIENVTVPKNTGPTNCPLQCETSGKIFSIPGSHFLQLENGIKIPTSQSYCED
jgi:hypothetical protein